MKIFIIGTGAVGYVLSNLLSEDKEISNIICATIDYENAKKYINIKNKKIQLIKLDSSKKENIIDAIKEIGSVDVIINASLPFFNETIMQAAIDLKTNYLDLCSNLADLKTPEQLNYHEQFKKTNISALINTGIAPGITNLFAKDLEEKFDKLKTLKFRLLEEQDATEFIPSWSIQVVIDELEATPLNFQNNQFKFVKPFENLEEFEFPKPYGKRMTVNLYGDEISTLPKYINVENIDYKAGGTDIEISRILFKMGFLNDKPIEFNGQKIIPVDFFSKLVPKVPTPKEMEELIKKNIVKNSIFISVVQGEGIKDGKSVIIKKTLISPDLISIQKIMSGSTYISYPTGVAAYLFLKVLLKMKEKGVFPPEALDGHFREEIFVELEKRGFKIIEEYQIAD